MKSSRKDRARKFAPKYCENGFNKAQAVIDCGITTNRKSAYVIGFRLLQDVTVKKAVEDHLKKAKITADEILEELSTMARAPVEKVSEAGKLKALELSGKAAKLFIDRTETTDNTEVESRKAFLNDQLQRLQSKHTDDPIGYGQSLLQLQSLFTDQTDPAYDPLLDYTKHPENWPPTASTPEATDANN